MPHKRISRSYIRNVWLGHNTRDLREAVRARREGRPVNRAEWDTKAAREPAWLRRRRNRRLEREAEGATTELDNAPPTKKPLYRGTMQSGDYTVGQRVSPGLRSWTSDEGLAREFSGQPNPKKRHQGSAQSPNGTVFEAESGTRASSISGRKGVGFGEEEYLTDSDYDVTGVYERNGRKVVKLRQRTDRL